MSRPGTLGDGDLATEGGYSPTRSPGGVPIPSGNVHTGIVRHMCPTCDGNLLIHQSSTDRIILMTLNGPGTTQ